MDLNIKLFQGTVLNSQEKEASQTNVCMDFQFKNF
jgi:hypothetical protein